MRRRTFIASVAGAAAWPLAARAQQARVPTIGVLVLGTPDPELLLRLLRAGLRQRGYEEIQDYTLDIRSAEGRADRLRLLATELVASKVDIIVAWQTPAAMAAKQATSRIPVVITGVGDAVATGLVKSLAQPGGNLTGTTAITAELGGKLIELIREVMPQMRRLMVLANAVDPFTPTFLNQLEIPARALGLDWRTIMVRSGDDIQAAFATIRGQEIDAVVIQPSLITGAVIDLAIRLRVPLVSTNRSLAENGGLLSYSSSPEELYDGAAGYIDQILRGRSPADLPVMQPTRFELTVNLKTARAIGVSVPSSIITRADEIIE